MLDEKSVRLEKLERLRTKGREPYSMVSGRNTLIGDALLSFDIWSTEAKELTFSGRILTIRVHGGMMFADLEESTGKIQVALKEDEIGLEAFSDFRDLLDPGDIIDATGVLFTTRRGEKSLKLTGWKILSKALLPLPEKWHGLQDVEKRYRHRELDLLANPESKAKFVARSRMIAAMRRFLDDQDFLEVETPVLQQIPGGANAKPFETHHNALDMQLFLRIAPELYLKRLLVGGFEKIYEVARCFRNEGIDYAHNPEFTQIELYWAFADKEDFFNLIEAMLANIVEAAVGTTTIATDAGALSFKAPYARITFREAILRETEIDIDQYPTIEALKDIVRSKRLKVDWERCIGLGEHLDELYKKTARTKLQGPVWVLDYPVEMKPLANRSPEDSTKSATAQLIVNGAEIVNAYYHELHDPLDQLKRFEEQQALSDKGSEEAQRMDQEFLSALEQGMPPAAGFGMGLDRLAAVITNSHSLKEVILFPTLRRIDNET